VPVLVQRPWQSAYSRSETAKWSGVQALFFGDFLLGQQKKVTRQPGRNPARSLAEKKPHGKRKTRRALAQRTSAAASKTSRPHAANPDATGERNPQFPPVSMPYQGIPTLKPF
jgi:hypothetical protein